MEERLPALVPGQHLGVLFVALRKVLFAETRHHLWVGYIRLFDKFFGRIEDLLFFPMNRNLRFAYLSAAFQDSLSSHDADLLFISIFELFYVSIRTPAIEPHFFASLAGDQRAARPVDVVGLPRLSAFLIYNQAGSALIPSRPRFTAPTRAPGSVPSLLRTRSPQT